MLVIIISIKNLVRLIKYILKRFLRLFELDSIINYNNIYKNSRLISLASNISIYSIFELNNIAGYNNISRVFNLD